LPDRRKWNTSAYYCPTDDWADIVFEAVVAGRQPVAVVGGFDSVAIVVVPAAVVVVAVVRVAAVVVVVVVAVVALCWQCHCYY